MAVKDDLKEAVEGLKQEVKELKEKVKDLIPFGKKERELALPANRASEDEHPVLALQRATNQLFNQFFSDFGWPALEGRNSLGFSSGLAGVGRLSLDIKETGDSLVVKADLPGLEKEDIEVTLLGGRLNIKGEKKQEQERKEEGYYRMERTYGVFQRSLLLPCEVVPDQVKATYKKGVLTIKLAKSEAARAAGGRIPVLSG